MNFLKKNRQKLVLMFYAFFILTFPLVIFSADPQCDPTKGVICNPIPSVGSVPDLIRIFLEGAIKIGSPIVALAIIYSGFLFVFARGNSEKLTKAKDALLYSLIGAAILLGSWAIAKMITTTVLSL